MIKTGDRVRVCRGDYCGESATVTRYFDNPAGYTAITDSGCSFWCRAGIGWIEPVEKPACICDEPCDCPTPLTAEQLLAAAPDALESIRAAQAAMVTDWVAQEAYRSNAAQQSAWAQMLGDLQPNAIFNINRPRIDETTLARAIFRVRNFSDIAAKAEVNVSGCSRNPADWPNQEAAAKFMRAESVMWRLEMVKRESATDDARDYLAALK